jgi:cephalosporin-C deacetylase-like acetyl esterase
MNALRTSLSCCLLLLAPQATNQLSAADAPAKPSRGDQMISAYFKTETAMLAERSLNEIKTLEDWQKGKERFRQQLFEMLSLSPTPERTDLKPAITGRIDHELVTVENLHFQSMPGLYVTANLYLPKRQAKPAPAVLYLCGHAKVSTNGVSYGNKTAYQHHGIWFARNGYVCLVVDTVQLGEIEGIHHGTHREGMWWWNSRGYTSAGVEAWNSIRAVDYLQSRPEVDPNRIGVTGRSGGGAYSWWVTALDDRIKVAAPVAGITDLENHVVDGAVEGHCDCMFTVNTYRWDYAQVAALAAPRPLLICNSDKDSIFPLRGVSRIHGKVREIYRLHNAEDKLGLLITEGPHKDTQDLQVPVFRWFNRHLKGEDSIIEMAAVKFFQPHELKVFKTLPSDERTSKIYESFVPRAHTSLATTTADAWASQRDAWMKALMEKSFAAWPHDPAPVSVKLAYSAKRPGLVLDVYEFESQHDIQLRLYALHRGRLNEARSVAVHVLDEHGWTGWQNALQSVFGQALDDSSLSSNKPLSPEAIAASEKQLASATRNDQLAVLVVPRGIGPTAWNSGERKQTQVRRRFMLLGQTLDSMRVWDIRSALRAVRSIDGLRGKPLVVTADGNMGVNVLYASLFEKDLDALRLSKIPQSQQSGPDYLNVLRVLDIPQAMAMAAERVHIELIESGQSGWEYPAAMARAANKRFRVSLARETQPSTSN